MKDYSIDSMQENTEDSIKEFILDDHPCVMAQSLVADDNLTIKDYKLMGEAEMPSKLLIDLKLYLESINEDDKKFQTFLSSL